MRASVSGMTLTPRHEEVEAGFRALLESADVDAPDAVGYEPDAVVFYWHEPKLAVFVDFDDDEVGADVSAHATTACQSPMGPAGLQAVRECEPSC